MINKADAIRFALDFSKLQSAYDATREGLRTRAESSVSLARARLGLSPDEKIPDEPDETGWSTRDEYWCWVGEIESQSDMAGELVREAFAIALFHLWERHANRWCGTDNYNAAKALAELEAIGRPPLVDDLRKLELLAHCLKHGPSSKPSGACNQLCRTHPQLFGLRDAAACENAPPSNEQLELSDDLIRELFQAVLRSGPPLSHLNGVFPLLDGRDE